MAETNPFADPNYGLEPGAQENPFSNPDYGKDTDGPLARGWKKSKQSIAISRDLTTGDVDSATQNIAEAERYARANPGLPEGRELSQAWDRGEGISGGVKEVAGEIKKDWDKSSNWVGGLRATGRNLRAMGEGVIEQVPNMVAPVTGMLAGGFAGAKVGGALGSVVPGAGTAAGAAVGGVAGGWAGASAGNAAIEGGYMAQEALQKAGIDLQDTQAVRQFLLERGDSIMGDAAVKGGIIGAVDVATLRLGSLLLNGPGRAATSRALADMGVDATDKAAVKAAMQTPQFAQRIAGDAVYQASRTGAQNVARNVGAAALDPAGEFAGEYLGQGVATGDWNAKNAALEAFSSVGQSGLMYAGQKAYQYATRPRIGDQPPAGPQGFAPTSERPVIDEAALGRAGIFPPAPAPIINERALEPAAPTPSQQMGLDPAAGPMSAAAALAVDTGASATMQQAAQAVDPETGEILEAGAKVPEQKQPTDTPEQMRERLGFIEQQARVNGGWDRRTIEERDRLQAELAKVESAIEPPAAEAVEPAPAIDVSGRTDDQLRVLEQSGRDGWREAAVAEIQRRAAQQPAEAPAPAVDPAAQAAVEQQAPAAPAPSIKDVLAKQIPDMTDGELQQAIDHYGPSNKRTAKLLKEVQRRSQGAPAAAVQPTQAPTALEQSRPAPSPRSESAQQSEAAGPAEEVRRQLREVETKILAAAPNAMGAGGGDIEAAMKSRKVPVTLKAQRKRLKEQLRQANQGEQAQNVQPAQVDAASGQGSGADSAGSAGVAPSGPVDLGRVDRPAGAPAPGSRARVPVGTAGAQQPAGVEGATDTAAPVAQPAAPQGARTANVPPTQQVAPQAQEARGQEGEKAKWIKATVDKSRLNGSGGVQLAVAPNGGVTFLGDPNTSKDGKALLANYEKALAAGATQQEIAAALQVQTPAPSQRSEPTPPQAQQVEPAPEQDRRPMPSGLSFPSERIVTSVQSEFEALEVQASSIGTSDGYVNFGSQYPDGRYYIESAGKSIGFANGQWGDVTPEGLKPRGTYDPSNLQAETIRVLESEGAKRSKSAAPAQPPADAVPQQQKPFDPVAWDKARADIIKSSRDAGNVHLDQVPRYVETMRGKAIFYVHDPKVRGTIRTVDSRGSVYVDWSDAYSAEKELASPTQEGKKTVYRSSIGIGDLKDYALAPDRRDPPADAARPDEGATAQPATPEFTTLKDRNGKTVTVRTADLSSARERMPTFTKEGKRKTTWIHRDNLDPTGEKQAEGVKEMAGNPLFNVITTKDGSAFASEAAAERELRRLGLQDTHEVAPASEVSSGSSGFVVRRAKAAEAAVPKSLNPSRFESSSQLIQDFIDGKRPNPPTLEEVQAEPAAAQATARPQPGDDGYTLEIAREDLAALRAELKKQGEDGRPVDSRLNDRVRNFEKLVASMEPAQKREQPAQASDDDIDAMFDDALADAIGEQQTGDAEPAATAEAPAATAVATEQPANQEAMAESLEDELRAQKKRVQRLRGGDATKLKAAEARLRAMRQSIFDAEDKWVPAARNGDQEALTKLEEAGFADTADAIRAFAPAAPRTAGKALKSAAKNAASALDDAINGLGKLFGGSGRLSSGLTFDEETYAKAKPLFIAAAANIRAASRDLRDVMKAVVGMVVERFGTDTAKNMKPYVTQFVKDVRDSKVQLEQEENADAGPTVHGDGASPLGEVAAEDDRGNARGGDAEPRGADGKQAGGEAGGRADDGGDAEARSGGNGSAGPDSAEAGAGGRERGRRVAPKAPKARKAAPTQQELKEEAAEEIRQASPINIPAIDFVITDEVELGKGTESVKFADNLAAIRALKQIEQENRRASPEEQRSLARYVGWGGLKNAFRVAGAKAGEGVAKGWESRVAELESLLTPAELRAARNSVTAAHFTSQTVVEAVWKGVERLGFRGGAVLEPSVGTGNFLGLMPANLRGNAKFLAAEYDSLTARIAQQLYPNQSILHTGFQDIPLPDNKFALAIGNPPFGKESLYFRHNPALNGKSIHNQFFLQSIQSLEADGLMGMVVSHNLMDAQDQASRIDMAVRAELVGAVRLPDTAFKENARTEVVTDILFFRKRGILEMNHAVTAARVLREGEGKRAAILKDFSPAEVAAIEVIVAEMSRWVPSSRQENFAGSGETVSVNPYFLNNPKQVVGTMDASGTMNARVDLNVRLDDPSTFSQRLDQAIERLPQRDPVDGVAQRTIAQFEQMATGMRLAVARAEPGAVRRTPDGALKVVVEMDDLAQSRKTILNEIELTAQTPFSEAYTLRTDGKWQREEDVTGADGKPVKKLKADGTPSNFNEKALVTYDSLDQIPVRDQWGADRIAVIADMLPVRDAIKRQLMLESSDAPSAMIEDQRKRLNAAYDAFTKKHGALHKASTVKIAMSMPDGALALAVEDVAKDGTTSRAAILSRRVTVPPKPVERVTNAGEAVAVVLSETGGIDIDRVARLLGTDEEGAAAALSEGDSPRAFFDPETNSWEPADGYLSGLVRRKLMAAKSAGLEKNVAALERVQPEAWDATQITPNIGSAWIPADVYADFMKHLGYGRSVVTYSPVTNTFSVVTTGSAKAEWVASERALGTSEIVERTLNSKPVKVIHKDSDGKTWVDEEATLESQMKATEIANEFLDWAFADDARRDRLVEVFNEKFNTRVVRQRDGSFLTLPGKVPDEVIKMRPWQLNAIWRGITDSAVLYDHAVGAGKTFTAIARAMERRRMGLSKKPMIVVPNHLVEQWAADVKKLYPGANVLAAGKEDFEKSRRRRLFARIGAGDYDMVIVGHSSFGFIDIDPATEERYLDEELRIAYEAVSEAERAAEEAGFSGWGKPMGVAEAERLVKKLEERLAKVRDRKRDRLLTFEEMGVDDLTIDEAHEFKNLAYSSNLQGAAGMGNKAGSGKAMDLNLKLRSLRERPGTSVAFLTGTPISNSVAEMYLVLKNLAPKELAELGMENFDAWRTTFVSASSAYEPTESGSLKEVTRLGREWMNMKSLMDLYYTIADAVTLQDMKDDFARANPGKSFPVPKVRSQIEGKGDRAMVAIKPSESQRAILREIVAGFDSLPGIENRKERNAERLRLMDRARKVSLDARAVSPWAKVPDGEGKIGAVVANVFATYEKWDADRGTQLIFLDRSVPKTKGDDKIIAAYDKLVADLEKATNKGDEKEIGAITEKLEKYSASEVAELREAQNGGWNAYAEIKRQLVAKGIPANEIRFVQEANTDKQKADLFALVRSGEVRVLIGSTPRMGAGTNVQDRLVALHHVDVTWKPSDIEQREGRIVRQGNELLEKYGDEFAVDVIAYATEMTVDAKMWSLNATKLKAINGIRKYDGSFMMEFDDEESASMAEMAALATGNPLMVERVMLDGDIKKLEMAQRTFNRRMGGIRSQIASAERTIKVGPQWAQTLRDFAQDMERKLAGVNERSSARRVTINGKEYASSDAAELAAAASIEEQQAKTESGKGRYVVEVNGEKATSKDRISALIHESMGDPGFEAEINDEKVIDLSSAVRAIIERRGSGREYTIDGITINGMSVEIDVAPSRWRPDTNSVATVAVLDKDGKPVLVREHSYESPVLSGSSLRAALQKVFGQFDPAHSRADAASQERAVTRAERELPELKAQAEKTFPQLEELNQKRSRLQEVVAALKASSDLARINVESDAEGDVESDVSGAIWQTNPLRNADGTFARQDPAGDSLAFSATLPRDRNAVRIGIAEKGLVRAMRLQFDGLADVTSKLLERGRAGKRGGVIVVGTADNAEIGRIVAERTGRKLDSTMRKFSSAGRLNGFYDPKTGLTFLVGPNLNPVTATAVMLHEMMHGQQRQKIDARALEMVRNRHGLKDEDLRAFLDRVMLRMIAAGEVGNAAEASAYIVEQAVIEGRSAGYTFADGAFMQWVDAKIGKRVGDFLRSFAGMIRTWMLRNGLGARTMTVDDFVGYAMAGLDRAAAGAVRGRASSRASIDAWHGSPYRFDRFDLGNVGMGEGAQSYGWGLYFAGSRGVAEHYKSKLAKAELFINGERSVLDYNDPAGNMARQEVLDAANAGIKDAVGYALLQNYVYPGVLERLQYWHENGIAEVRKGALYKVSIAPDEDTFLLWDKPLSEQPKKVTQGLRSAIDAMFGNGTFDAYAAAGNDWRDMKDNLLENTSEKDVSLMMKANGIAGVKYLDGMSRDGSGGSFNYVVFDDADVEIDDIHFSRSVGDAPAQEAQRVQSAIEGKTLIEAAQFLTRSNEGAKAAVAQKVLEKLQRLEKAGVALDLKIVHRGDMAPASMVNARGYTETGFDEKGRDIVVWLNGADVTGKVGTEEEVLLHELVHAATAGMVFYGTQTPDSLAGKHARDLMAATDAIAEHIRKRFDAADAGKATLTEFEQDMRDGANNAFRSDDEVLAWALSNSEAQAYLETIPYRSGSMWSNFVQAVRNLLGLSARNDTALSEVLRVAERILTDDAPNAGRAAFWHKRNIRMAQQQARGSIAQTAERGDEDLQFSRSGLRELASRATAELNNTLTAPGKLSWWHKTVGTMYNLAERSPAFRPVFQAAQGFIDDVSHYAADAAERAPRLLPRLDTWRDILKSPISAEDNAAVGKPIFEGTLSWTRDADGRPVRVDALIEVAADMSVEEMAAELVRRGAIEARTLRMWRGMADAQYESAIRTRYENAFLQPGIVWTDSELASMFSLTPAQTALYREFRAAVDRSLDTMARADMLRFAGEDVRFLRDPVMEAPTLRDAASLIVASLNEQANASPDRATQLMATGQGITDRMQKVMKLQAQGYAPLSRFGKYTVDVVVDGNREYFGLFESAREANKMAERMRAEFGAGTVTQGTLSDEAFRLFAGITPESLELFGNMLGLDSTGDEAQDRAFQEYLRLTKTNRSALRRLIHRKGIAGFSEDVSRVLASFAYSNARQTAAGLHMGDLSQAVSDIPKEQGELKDVAVKLSEYIKNPQEEAQAIRGLLFAQYLGGSVASAFVNMTQPAAVTFPWLSQHGGAKMAAAEIGKAAKHIATRGHRYEPDLAEALKAAEEDGVVSPQEVHQLMAQARGSGSLKAGDGTRAGNALAMASNSITRLSAAWGKLFSAAEQLNRRITFIAAYRVASQQRMANPAEFARRAVTETQFVYSKASKMQWGRGAVGGTLMTFKTYSVAYMELMSRLWSQGAPGSAERKSGRKAVALMLAMVLLMGGGGGLPFMEDAEDLIDGIAQIAGYNVSTKKARQQFLIDTFGADAADFIERGVSGLPGVPLDVSGRLGLGNLIPGTGIFLDRSNHTRDILELLGPVGDLGNRIVTGARKALSGDVGGAALEVSPVAVRNVAKGVDMAVMDQYRDTRGRKVLDTTDLEAALKAIGFQPASVAKVQDANYLNQRAKDFYSLSADRISATWAAGIYEKDSDKVQKARDMIAQWNEDNPDQPMMIRMPNILRRVREMGKDKAQRIADTAPRAMRQQLREDLMRQ